MSDASTPAADSAPAIVGQLVKVMESVGAIEKSQTNPHFRYKFRGIDDAMSAVQPALIEHGVVCTPRVLNLSADTFKSKSGTMRLSCVEVEYTFRCELDGSTLIASGYGEGADTADKSVAKAMSACFKQVLFQALCIPTEETPDADRETPQFDHGDRQPQAPAQPKRDPKSPKEMLLAECARFAHAKITELGVEKQYNWKDLCLELAGKDGPEMSLDDAHALKASLEKWLPAMTSDGEAFVNDPPLNDGQRKQLHVLAGLVTEAEAHDTVSAAAKSLGFDSSADVTDSRYADMRRAIEALIPAEDPKS